METESKLQRVEQLLGADMLSRLQATHVAVFGVGGVGSWCAESLVRTGVGHLTIVDGDVVAPSNVNRQAMATTSTIGRVKVEALRERLLDINPDAQIDAFHEVYNADNDALFPWGEYDYVVDAIDSLSNKMDLILRCTRKGEGMKLFSSMGAAMKVDPTQVRVSEFWEVDGCPLAATLRRRMRRAKRFPERKFRCVWSPEVIRTGEKGSLVHITAIMGFTLAGLIVKDITSVRP